MKNSGLMQIPSPDIFRNIYLNTSATLWKASELLIVSSEIVLANIYLKVSQGFKLIPLGSYITLSRVIAKNVYLNARECQVL